MKSVVESEGNEKSVIATGLHTEKVTTDCAYVSSNTAEVTQTGFVSTESCSDDRGSSSNVVSGTAGGTDTDATNVVAECSANDSHTETENNTVSNERGRTCNSVADASSTSLLTMHEILTIEKSPYEDETSSAEIDEECFVDFKNMLDSIENRSKLDHLLGEKLSTATYEAYDAIKRSGMIFSASWKEGKICNENVGWIPRKLLLVLLQQDRFHKATLQELQALVKNTDSFELVIGAMKKWNLINDYPRLASNLDELSFSFESNKEDCYKCEIFVARVFSTLQLMKKLSELTPSLLTKIKSCLSIMNVHVRANQTELAKWQLRIEEINARTKESVLKLDIQEGKKKVKSKNTKLRSLNNSIPKKRKQLPSDTSRKITAIDSSRALKKSADYGRAAKLRKMVPKIPGRKEESLLLSFRIICEQSQRCNQMINFFKHQLVDHRDILKSELKQKMNEEKDKSSK